MRENSIEQLKITEKQFKNEADKKVKELFSKAGAEDDEEISRDDVITDEIKASTEARQKQLKKDWSEAERKEAAREDEEATVSEETEPKEKEPKKERELEKYKIIETEALRDRSVELWDERSKILMEKSSQGKTDKFQAIEEEMTEIREELKGRGVKFELNKWMKEEKKEEEAEGEGESPEEEKAEKTAEEKVETQEKTKEEKAEIFPDVLSGFDKLGIKELDLESIKSFSGLSEGQQLLVLENLKQLNLGRIQEEAAVEYRKNTAESKFLGRIWQGISKKYQIAKLEKVTVNKIKKGGMKAHQETLQQLVNGMQKFGTEVKVQDGKLEIQYASGFENLTPEQQKQVDEFNQIATEYSKIPYEWSLETTNKKDKKIHEEVKEKYENAKENILRLKQDEAGEKNSCLYMNDVEMKVKLNQFLNSNPDVEKQLQNIKNKAAWKQVWKDIVTERGIYAGAGFLTRTAMISLIGIASAPFVVAGVAGGMGGFLARRRAKGTLKERDVLARKGMEDKSKEAKDFVDAEYIHESIDFLFNELNKESLDADKKDEIIRSLKFHIEDAKNKIEDGTVNYGGKENRLFNQYELIKKISEGAIAIEYNGLNKEKYQRDIEVIGEFLKKQDKTISAAQKKYLRDQMIRGAVISAGFATAGYAIRHFAEELGWLGGPKEAIKPVEPDFSEADKATLEALGNLSDADKEHIAKHGLHDYNIKKTLEAMPLKPEEAVEEASPLAGELPDDKIKDVPPETLEKIKKIAASQEALKEVAAKAAEQEVTIKERIGLATIKKGEGIEHALIRQLKADPEKFGFKGDPNNTATVKKWAGIEAHRTAIKAGYVDAESGHEIRVGTKGINKAAYVLEKDADGNVKVHEYFKGEDIEEHKLAEDFKGAEFEGKGKENYEYIHENKGVAQEVAVEEAEVKPVATESGVVAETAESAPIIEVWSEETREKLEQVLNVENITSDDVEKINEIVNLKNGIQPKEEPLLKFLAEHKELINEPKFFELSEKTGIEYDKPHFLETYNNMPGDIKNSGMKAEGFMEVFAGSKAKVSLGLKKLFNFTADPSWKIKTDGTVIIENAYAKKGLNILLTKEDIAVEKSRWWGSSKNLFKSDLNLESVSKAKSEVTRLYK